MGGARFRKGNGPSRAKGESVTRQVDVGAAGSRKSPSRAQEGREGPGPGGRGWRGRLEASWTTGGRPGVVRGPGAGGGGRGPVKRAVEGSPLAPRGPAAGSSSSARQFKAGWPGAWAQPARGGQALNHKMSGHFMVHVRGPGARSDSLWFMPRPPQQPGGVPVTAPGVARGPVVYFIAMMERRAAGAIFALRLQMCQPRIAQMRKPRPRVRGSAGALGRVPATGGVPGPIPRGGGAPRVTTWCGGGRAT